MKTFPFALLLSATLCLAAAASPDKPLTLAAALAAAAQKHPALAAAHHDERAAGALAEQAALHPNPTLDVSLENFGGTGRRRGVDDLEATVQASQTIERGDKRGRRVAAAERDRDIAAAQRAVLHAEVLAATAVAYVQTLAAQQHLTLAAEPLQLAEETLAAAEARVKAGAASPAEPARARAALASARIGHARAQSTLTRARAALAAQWGGSPADAEKLAGHLAVPDALPSEENFRSGLNRHPRVALQEAITASRRAGLSLAEAQAVTDVTVAGGLRFLRDGSDAALVAGVSVPLSFRNRNQGNIRAAREYLAGAERSAPTVAAELHAAFAATWQDLAAAHAAVQGLRLEALPATAEAHAFVRRAYAEGHLPLIDVLDAQRALVDLRRELLEAEAAYATALARLEGLTNPEFSATTALLSSP